MDLFKEIIFYNHLNWQYLLMCIRVKIQCVNKCWQHSQDIHMLCRHTRENKRTVMECLMALGYNASSKLNEYSVMYKLHCVGYIWLSTNLRVNTCTSWLQKYLFSSQWHHIISQGNKKLSLLFERSAFLTTNQLVLSAVLK